MQCGFTLCTTCKVAEKCCLLGNVDPLTGVCNTDYAITAPHVLKKLDDVRQHALEKYSTHMINFDDDSEAAQPILEAHRESTPGFE